MKAKQHIPNHLAIIMDGNGRWATKRGLKRSKGHLEGSKVLREIAEYAINKGVSILSVFAFSTENFNRSEEEINYIMRLLNRFLNKELKTIKDNKIKIIFSGRKDKLPSYLLKTMLKTKKETKDYQRAILNVCINYGGTSEIIDATKKILANQIDISKIDEKSYRSFLYHNLADIDLLIRTGGEYRISNFMLLQMAYAELYFTDTYWPDFNKEELDKALIEFEKRDRRFGGY